MAIYIARYTSGSAVKVEADSPEEALRKAREVYLDRCYPAYPELWIKEMEADEEAMS